MNIEDTGYVDPHAITRKYPTIKRMKTLVEIEADNNQRFAELICEARKLAPRGFRDVLDIMADMTLEIAL